MRRKHRDRSDGTADRKKGRARKNYTEADVAADVTTDVSDNVTTEAEAEARRLDESMPAFMEQSDPANPELDAGRNMTCTSCGRMIQLPDKEEYSISCVCKARYSREVVKVQRRVKSKRGGSKSFVGEQIANGDLVFQIVHEQYEQSLTFGEVVHLILKPIGRTK